MTKFPRITSDAAIMGGKPCIVGTRIPVDSVLAHLSGGMSIADYLADFPDINEEDVLECLAYASAVVSEISTPLPEMA